MKKNKEAVKRVRKLHRPMIWSLHDVKDVCSECKVPYPCKTITALNGE
jgi:hypothetical protein